MTGENTSENQFKQLKSRLDNMVASMNVLHSKIDQLTAEKRSFDSNQKMLMEIINKQDNESEQLMRLLKKNNPLFFGILDIPEETPEKWIIELINNKLKFLATKHALEETKRLGKINQQKRRPIFVQCPSFNFKHAILKNLTNLSSTTISVWVDFSKQVQEDRKVLLPFLKDAKKNGNKPSLAMTSLLLKGRNTKRRMLRISME